MNLHTQTSDVVGLTRTAPLSRRGFMTATAATAAGYTLAAGPVRAEVIKTELPGVFVHVPGAAFAAQPDWWRNCEYARELERGFDGHEDLFFADGERLDGLRPRRCGT